MAMYFKLEKHREGLCATYQSIIGCRTLQVNGNFCTILRTPCIPPLQTLELLANPILPLMDFCPVLCHGMGTILCLSSSPYSPSAHSSPHEMWDVIIPQILFPHFSFFHIWHALFSMPGSQCFNSQCFNRVLVTAFPSDHSALCFSSSQYTGLCVPRNSIPPPPTLPPQRSHSHSSTVIPHSFYYIPFSLIMFIYLRPKSLGMLDCQSTNLYLKDGWS